MRAKGGAGGDKSSSIPGGDDAAVAPPLSPAAAAATEQALAAISAADAIAEAPTHLVLIGGRGCGKSSMCRRIAALDSRWQLFPLDTLIQYEAEGLSIAEIVAAHGTRRRRTRCAGSCGGDPYLCADACSCAVRARARARLAALPRLGV